MMNTHIHTDVFLSDNFLNSCVAQKPYIISERLFGQKQLCRWKKEQKFSSKSQLAIRASYMPINIYMIVCIQNGDGVKKGNQRQWHLCGFKLISTQKGNRAKIGFPLKCIAIIFVKIILLLFALSTIHISTYKCTKWEVGLKQNNRV